MKNSRYNKELPVITHIASKINPAFSQLLSKPYEGWFYNRFVNIISYDKQGQHIVDFVDNNDEFFGSCTTLISVIAADELTYDSFIDFLVDSIEDDQYIGLWGDEYYIHVSVRYEKSHFVHPLTIYGINDNQACCEFFSSVKGMIFTQIPLKEIWQAYCHVSEYYMNGASEDVLKNTIFCYKVDKSLNKPFDIATFYQTLSCYLYGQPDPWNKVLSGPDKSNIVYGIAYYNDLIDIVTDDNRYQTLPFKCLFDLRIHKQFLVERLKYICGIIGEVDFEGLVASYKTVEKLYESMYMLNLKYNSMNVYHPNSLSSNPEFRQKLLNLLKKAYNMEKVIVNKIVAYLDRYLDRYIPDQIDNFTVEMSGEGLIFKSLVSEYLCGIQIGIGHSDNITEPVQLELSNGWVYHLNKSGIANTYSFRPAIIEWAKITGCTSLRLFRRIKINDEGLKTLESYTVEKWRPMNHINNWYSNRNKVCFDINGIDPYIVCQGENVDASRYQYITVEYETNDTSNKAQIFFMTDSSPLYSSDKLLTFSISPLSGKHSYKLDLSGLASWRGIVTMIRLDPVHYSAGSKREKDYSQCTIHKISVTCVPPVYSNKSDFSDVQGMNNWEYCCYSNGINLHLQFDSNLKKWTNISKDVFVDIDCQQGSEESDVIRQWRCTSDGLYKINLSYKEDAGMDSCLYVDDSQVVLQNDNMGFLHYSGIIDIKKESFIKFITRCGYANSIRFEIQKVL